MGTPSDAGRVAALVGLLFGLAGMGSAAVAVTLPEIGIGLSLSVIVGVLAITTIASLVAVKRNPALAE